MDLGTGALMEECEKSERWIRMVLVTVAMLPWQFSGTPQIAPLESGLASVCH